MKLYTREQMIEAFNYGKTLKAFDWIGDMIDSLEAIELPSDEEIEKFAFEKYHEIEDSRWFEPLQVGAKWLKNKIQGGNK